MAEVYFKPNTKFTIPDAAIEYANRLLMREKGFKTKLEPDTWSRGTMGDLKAIDEIYRHNRMDVITLEKVYHILKPYSSGARRSI